MVTLSKVRIYELAKETGLSNKEVINRLSELGIDAKSHSSSLSEGDALRFRESLGKAKAERDREEQERARREAEQYDLSKVGQPSKRKASKMLPPHLRRAQEQEEEAPAAPAARVVRPPAQAFKPAQAGSATAGGGAAEAVTPAAEAPARPATPPARPGVPPARPSDAPATSDAPPASGQPARPGAAPARPAAAPVQPAAAQDATAAPASPRRPAPPPDPRRAAEIAAQGVVRGPGERPAQQPVAPAARTGQSPGGPAGGRVPTPRPGTKPAPIKPSTQGTSSQQPAGDGTPQGTPGVPRPGTPPRPGQPTVGKRPLSPAATGQLPEARRKVQPNLPKEGTGKRSIPPPLKAAPKDQPSRPGGGRPGGRPGGGGRPPGPGTLRPGQAPGAGPNAGRGKGKKAKKRRGDLSPQEQFEQANRPRRGRKKEVAQAQVEGPVDVVPGITVNEFAKLIGVNPTGIIAVLFRMGEMVTVTQSMSNDLIELVAAEMGAEINFVEHEELLFADYDDEDDPADLVDRPPVVTVMGHVDHGKTLLLDSIRNADVVSGEAGGITQHIGAYQVTREGRKITFIDTPGHEAFTAMRARGASVTDVAILVVAADDGVKPQTVEAIDHIKAAEVPLIVAVNKIDKENADAVRVRTQLTEYDLIAEEFGGQTTMVDVSAKTGQNLDELLDLILLQADVEETKANPNREASGTVIEAHLDRGRGAVATVLVQNGTLRVGDNVVAGVASCKVRAMFDDEGGRVEEAEPAKPVQVLGWSDVPDAGDDFRVVEDERTARDIAGERASRARKEELANRPRLTLEGLGAAVKEGQLTTLNLVVKGDVAGTVEAVAAEMTKLDLEGVRTRIVRKGVGAVTNDDVVLAEASQAIIIAFNVRPEAQARQAIEESGVDLRQYSIIYKAIEDIQAAIKGLLAPEFEEVVVGRSEVREVFKVPRAGFVFGSYVTSGTIKRNAQVRIIRDSVVVADDVIASLRRFKDDVAEVREGFECGIGLEKFQDIKVGDEFEVYEEQEIARD